MRTLIFGYQARKETHNAGAHGSDIKLELCRGRADYADYVAKMDGDDISEEGERRG